MNLELCWQPRKLYDHGLVPILHKKCFVLMGGVFILTIEHCDLGGLRYLLRLRDLY